MKVSLTSTERAALRAIQKTARERWVYVRVTAVLMVDQGLTVSQTADLLGIDDNTVYRTLQDYRAKSGEGFLSRGGGGSSSLLSFVQIGGLSRRLGERLFRSAREVCDWVADEFGIAYSESGMVKLLNRIGYTYKQT